MKDIIKAVVKGLSSKVAFYAGTRAEMNAIADDESNDIIALMLMYDKDGEVYNQMSVLNEYHIDILFLKRSDLDLDFETRYANYLDPMEGLADEFFLKLKEYIEKDATVKTMQTLKRYKVYSDVVDIFDVNYDGALIQIPVPLDLDISYCLNNYTLNIDSDGAAVNDSITWLHDIASVSSDNVNFSTSADLNGTGYTFSISAGSGTTGSFTFTPIVGKDYSFKKRFYVRWADGVTTPMNVKVNYTYNS